MWKYLVCALALWPAASLAQIVVVAEIDTSLSAPPGFEPVGIGGPHVCAGDFPTATARLTQAQLRLDFIINRQGTLADLTVDRSSGDATLDAAALSCARRWIYRPAMLHGKPVDFPRQATIRWFAYAKGSGNLTGDRKFAPVALDLPHDCRSLAPNNTVPPQVVTSLVFTLPVDGIPKDIRTEYSSGDAAFDQAAVTCAARWRYRPVLNFEDNTPVEHVWRESITWGIAPETKK